MAPLGTSDSPGRSHVPGDDRGVFANAIGSSKTLATLGRARHSPATRSSLVLSTVRRVLTSPRHDGRWWIGKTLPQRSTLTKVAEHSRAVGFASWVDVALNRSFSRSRTESVLRNGERVARRSFIYRWLTEEPEPEVIVLDLHETYAIGPVIAAIEGLRWPWRLSSTRVMLMRTRHLLTNRPLGVLGALLLVLVLMTLIVGLVRADLDWPRYGLAVVLGLIGFRWLRSSVTWTELRSSRAITRIVRFFEPPRDDD